MGVAVGGGDSMNSRTEDRRDPDQWRYASAAVSLWGLLFIAFVMF